MLALQMVCEAIRSRLERPTRSFVSGQQKCTEFIESLCDWQLQRGWQTVLYTFPTTNPRKEVCFA